jgi:hypothetical protein
MKSGMRIRPLLATAFATLAFSIAAAQDLPPVNAPFALAALVTRQGQLAVSGDGRWRVHVDASNQLNRVSTANHVEAGHVALPFLVNAVVLARDGGRAALLSQGGCVGIVDFAPTVSMRWVVLDAEGMRWSSAPPPACSSPDIDTEQPDQHFGLRVLALSDDGRLVATRTGVIDLEARRVVARLPQMTLNEATPATVPTELHFVDGGKRLFALLAGLRPPEDHYDLYHAALLQAAVWDLGTRRLLRLIDIPTTTDTGLGLATTVDLASGDVWSVGADPRGGDKLALMRTPVAECRGQPQRVAAVDANVRQWLGDPRQRWLAQLKWDAADLSGRRTAAGLTLRVDAIGGTTLLRADSDRDLKIVSSPDGATLFGLRMPPPSKAWPPVKAFGGDVLEWHIAGAARAATSEPVPWAARTCTDPTELPGAREVVLQPRPMVARWERHVPLVQTERDRIDSAAAVKGRCSESAPADVSSAAFVRADGSLWLDVFDRYEQIDPATGLALAHEATVRKAGTCAKPAPAADGSVAWAGDTLSLRSFGTGSRRPIDVRPGWQVALVALDAGQVRVRWIPKVDKPAAASAVENSDSGSPFHDVVYDVHGWRTVSEVVDRDDPNSDGPDSAYSYFDQAPGTCKAPDGRIRSGWDIEVALDDVFESLRGVACDPHRLDGVGLTAMRLGVDLEPGNTLSTGDMRTTVASGGTIGVVQEGDVLRVFDIPRRHELGRIALARAGLPPKVHVLADPGWIIVDTRAADQPTTEHVIRGYEIPR